MAQTKPSTPSINLLPNKGGGFAAQFLDWSLTIGRLLIILTETVALGTFIYRFSLDMKIVDLHDKIKIESLIVQNFSKSEENFRNLQDRLSLIKKYDATAATVPTLFQSITEMGRNKITFRTLLVSTESVKIEAQARSATTLSLFVNDLKNHPEIASVSIETVENSTTNGLITVSLTAPLKHAAKQQVQAMNVNQN